MSEWGIDLSELNGLIKKLESAGANMEAAAKRAINSAAPIVAGEMSKHMPRSPEPRKPSRREPWRTGVHAADDIKTTGIRQSMRGSLYKVVGPSRGDNDPHFYMKFIEYGARYIKPKPYMEPTINASKDKVVEKLKESLLKDLGLFE